MNNDYEKPVFKELSENEMHSQNGGGVPVVVAVLAAGLLIVAGYTVAFGVVLANVAGAVNLAASANKVVQ